MGFGVFGGATLACSFGMAPSTLMVPPAARVTGKMPMAGIMDQAPMVNIIPFGMCSSMANPTVASATAAALGVLTPMPCIPVIPAPWAPGNPTVMVGGKPCLNDSSQCMCAYGGVIQIQNPGTTDVQM
ncbi:MAG: DUF4280 domain-containing protein [Lachnospiraceae bacterium]|nr:DUF4280 domain-containing protein [Lachnospiraceae bacterium]